MLPENRDRTDDLCRLCLRVSAVLDPFRLQSCSSFDILRLYLEKTNAEPFPFRFLPALLTAVLTNHLAWVPTVMPNGQPPIRIFLEKHSSQSVDMLAKTHPYNPLWAQLGTWQTAL